MPTTYRELIPENAEVIVDYAKPPKEMVQFDFPVKRTYRQAIKHSARRNFRNHWFVMNLILLKYVYLPFLVGFAAVWLLLGHPPVPYFSAVFAVTSGPNILGAYWASLFGVAYFILSLGVPSLAGWFASLQPKVYSRMVPEMNYFNSKFLRKLKSKLVKPEDLTGKMFIIPFFSNVYLDWNPSGDFNRYLTKVEVLNIPEDYCWEHSGKKAKPNEFNFRAVFYFSKKPEKGYMKVIFD